MRWWVYYWRIAAGLGPGRDNGRTCRAGARDSREAGRTSATTRGRRREACGVATRPRSMSSEVLLMGSEIRDAIHDASPERLLVIRARSLELASLASASVSLLGGPCLEVLVSGANDREGLL